MSISSKKIISYVYENDPPFSAHRIARDLFSPAKGKRSNAGKKKKKDASGENAALSKTGDILRALAYAGFLNKKRKEYYRNRGFKLTGRVILNTTGSAILKTDDGDDILIGKEDLNKARNNDKAEAVFVDYADGELFGKITRILERKKDEYFAKVTQKNSRYVHFKLVDVYSEMDACAGLAEGRNSNAVADAEFAIVRLTDEFISGKQLCEVVTYFSSIDRYDVGRIMAKHSLPGLHKEYAELEHADKIMRADIQSRKNYRDIFTITIDGERAKDFDDAVSLEKTENGFTLYVHIADVSSFVKKGSELDGEAFKRGTSYYLGNSVIPMLPEMLSNDLCSLKAGVDRLTLSAEIIFDKYGNDIGHGFYRGIINVDKRMTYISADKAIDGEYDGTNATCGDPQSVLRQMFELASMLKKNRLKRGRVDLDLPDHELVYDRDDLKDIEFAERLRSHMIIEEFMLSANETVSRALTENNIPSLYRVHENISDEKLLSLKNFFRTLGITLKETKNIGLALQKVIDNVKGREYEKVVNFLILKSFMQAYYGADPLGHFGLGFADYTHFTSPIRRYPDLVVHRCLKSLIDKSPAPYETGELELIGEQSSEMERIAQNAERDLFKLISCRYMQDKVGDVFDAIVSGIGKAGFFVSLIDKPIEGMVPLRFLTDDYYLVKEDDYSVTGRRLGRRFRIGDRLRVRLKEVSYETMRIDFDVVKN